MKILFIKEKRAPNGIEGQGIYLLNLCKQLTKINIKFIIIYNDKDELYRRFKNEEFDLRLVPLPPSSSRNLYSGFHKRKKITKHIHNIVLNEKITHISVQFPYFLNYVSTKWNIPIFCHQHAAFEINDPLKFINIKNIFDFKKLINEFYKKKYVFNFEKAKKIIAVSKSSFETTVKKYNADSKKIIINDYGINKITADNFKNIKKEFSYKDDDKIILCIGRVTKDKGVEDFCKVAEKLTKYKFIFVGGYRNEKYYHSIYQRYSNIVNFLGERNDVFNIYKSSDIFLTLSHRESAGLVLMEAMNFSLPLIGWDICGIRDVINDDDNGYLCQFGNIDQVVEKINLLFENQSIYNQKSINSFKSSSKYTIEKNTERLINIFNENF